MSTPSPTFPPAGSPPTSEARHTPGPWPISYVRGAIRHLVRNVDYDCFWAEDDKAVAVAAGFYGWDKFNDSNLIAAAPDLLAACQCLLDAIHDSMTHELQAHHADAIKAAQAAIAAAKPA